MVIDHHGQHVSGSSVAAQEDQIVELRVRGDHAALHTVVDDGFTFARGLEANDRIDPRGRFGRIAIAPRAVIKNRAPFRTGALAHCCKLFLRAVALIGVSGDQHLVCDGCVPAGARVLINRLVIPFEAKPPQAVENGIDRICR